MDTTALMLSRLQFAFTVSFHIIFPSFTIGLAAWLTVLEALHLITRRPVYRRVFDFWLKIFGIAFGMGVVSGIVLARVRRELERTVTPFGADSGTVAVL
jgi:cytochrome d ubiquinol oxidase subunit I